MSPRSLRSFRVALTSDGSVTSIRVTGDPEQPCLEAAAFAEGRAILQNPHEDILDEVLGGRAIARHPVEIVEERHLVALEEQSQLGDIAPTEREHQGTSVTSTYLGKPSRRGKVTAGVRRLVPAAS